MKTLLTIIFFLITALGLQAQQEVDSVIRLPRPWMLPSHFKVQFAGSMGLISSGIGYEILKNKAELDIYAGYTPESVGGDYFFTFTPKFTYKPWHIGLKNNWSVTPLTTGAFFVFTTGSEFKTYRPDYYPRGYYWWSDGMRPNIFIGGMLHKKSKRETAAFTNTTLYYELGSNDLKMTSYILNTQYFSILDVLHLGIGLKFNFE